MSTKENEMQEIITMARNMRTLQTQKDVLEEELKAVNQQLDDLRLRAIPEAMAELDIRTLTVEGIGRVQLALDCYATIKDKVAGYQWLQEHGYDGLVTEYIQPSTFKAAVKDALKQGQSFPEELFNIQPFTRASIVKV
jgi:hypothetical protein